MKSFVNRLSRQLKLMITHSSFAQLTLLPRRSRNGILSTTHCFSQPRASRFCPPLHLLPCMSRSFSSLVAEDLVQKRAETIVRKLCDGNRAALSESITLVESRGRSDHAALADAVMSLAMQNLKKEPTFQRDRNFRLGIAGPPGAGKSTFIEALGLYLCKSEGLRVAVLAVDPSSSRTGGSILGDKTRMLQLSRQREAFVRPSPTRGTMGGVSLNTNEAVLLCEAAGYDIVIVETVGVGQSETEVENIADMMMLLVPPSAGDELQAVKKGIVEMADLIVVNKYDGTLKDAARIAATELRRALQLVRPKLKDWKPQVRKCSALQSEGIVDVWKTVLDFIETSRSCGRFERKRFAQSREWLWSQVHYQLWESMKRDETFEELVENGVNEMVKGEKSVRGVGKGVLKNYFEQRKVLVEGKGKDSIKN